MHIIIESINIHFSPLDKRSYEIYLSFRSIPKLNELAFSTKATCWSCENEVRLIDFDKGINEDYKSIDLDKDSYIDEIIFGYKSAQPFQKMIMNVVSRLPYGNKVKFSKMQKNLRENIYKLKIVDVTSQ